MAAARFTNASTVANQGCLHSSIRAHLHTVNVTRENDMLDNIRTSYRHITRLWVQVTGKINGLEKYIKAEMG